MGSKMKKFNAVIRWSMACVVLQVGGCGKTEDGGVGNEAVSDEGSRPLADLSEAEVTDVCEEFWRIYADVTPAYARGICVVESAESTSNGASCDAAVEVCVDELEVVPLSIGECAETLDFAGCEASVAELNECIAAQREQVERIAALQSCEDALDEPSAGEWLDDPPACERLLDRCPATFEELGEMDGPDTEVSPGATPHVIEGTVDGERVEIRPNGGLLQSHSVSGEFWNSGVEFGGAALWLWGEVATAQGLLRMPPSGPEVPSWLCLDTVEIDRGTETSTWESSKLSMLPLCGEGDTQPLDLAFAVGYPVSGTHQGEAVSWVSTGFACDSACRFAFEAADTAWRGRDRWLLEVDTLLEPGTSREFEHSTLIHPGGEGAVACGGGGVVSYADDGEIQIVVDALGPLTHCPGAPIAGELRGEY